MVIMEAVQDIKELEAETGLSRVNLGEESYLLSS
jgi:hypothetical protein